MVYENMAKRIITEDIYKHFNYSKSYLKDFDNA
jgi:hypothetical protein